MKDILTQLEQLEAAITYTQMPAAGELPFRHTPGTLPIIISAPHGAAHLRDGRDKQEDEFTAAFARLIAEQTGAHALYSHARLEGDPNWDRHSPYKDQLRRLVAAHDIRFVLDIHGMSNRHKFGIAVGTMCGASCAQQHESAIVEALTAAGFRRVTAAEAREFQTLQWDSFVINHHRFTGGVTSHTVTRYAAEVLGIHAAQLELCADLRIVRRRSATKWPADFRGDPVGIVRAVETVIKIVEVLSTTGGELLK